ncbi:response regulator transcription factor [bacterium]
MEKKILIVDDEKHILEASRIYLEKLGYSVLTAENGVDGLNMANDEKPDLVILDIIMPKMNGFDVCKKLKEKEETQSIPVIMLTALCQVVDELRGFESGVDVYLNKPFEFSHLLKEVRKLLNESTEA